MKLPIETFKTVVRSTPLVSIDLVVRNSQGQVLLGERLNRPAQGNWFVPGGRILKDETFAQAFSRLSREELGVVFEMSHASFLGPYEHLYPDNFAGDDFTTHYVVLAYELVLDLSLVELPQEQHGRYRWVALQEALQDPKVHRHTQAYLRDLQKD